MEYVYYNFIKYLDEFLSSGNSELTCICANSIIHDEIKEILNMENKNELKEKVKNYLQYDSIDGKLIRQQLRKELKEMVK